MRFAALNAVLVIAVGSTLFPLALQSAAKQSRGWHYPDDRNAVVSQAHPTPFNGNGLPEGITSVVTKYREPGMRVFRPGGRGYWQFKNVTKLYYRGRLFALIGRATCVSEAGNVMGCLQALVIYDEDGDGKLDSPEDMNHTKTPFVFHLPKWLMPPNWR